VRCKRDHQRVSIDRSRRLYARIFTNGEERTVKQQRERNHARLLLFICLVFVILFLLSRIVSKADNTTGNEDVTVGEQNDDACPTQRRKKTIWREKEKDSEMCISKRFLRCSSSFDDDDDSEDEEVLKRERLEAVQFAMQSFDVSDETFNAGVKVAEEEDDRDDALKTNVAEFVGAVRGGSSSSSGRGGGGGRRKSKDERGSGAGNNKNAAREERQKRQRRPKSSNIANVARETKMSNREVKKSRKVRAVFMGSMDDDDDNNEREEENEDGGSFGGTRFELKEGTSEVLKTSSVSDDKTTNGEIIDVPRIEQRDNNNDKEAVLLTFLNENRMLSEDDDESSRITASNLTKCNDAIRRCTSFEEVLPLVKEMR